MIKTISTNRLLRWFDRQERYMAKRYDAPAAAAYWAVKDDLLQWLNGKEPMPRAIKD